jgi:UDP-2,3-diacylglucosamine pyrophosphatase LpxH
MQHSKWLAKLGAVGYDTLILINRFFNFISEKVFNKGKISLSKKIKNSVKSAVKFINNFEQTSADIGISIGFDYVNCGHIHQSEMRVIENNEGSIVYLKSGDWIENLTALEFVNGEWNIFRFKDSDHAEMLSDKQKEDADNDLTSNQLFDIMLQ